MDFGARCPGHDGLSLMAGILRMQEVAVMANNGTLKG
jgi:hypothetical protein